MNAARADRRRSGALVAVAILAVLAVPVIAEDITGIPYTCDAEYQEPTVGEPGYLELMCTDDETGEAFRIRWDRVLGIGDLTCSVAVDSEGSLFLDISCTENEPYDFRVAPKGVTAMGSTRFVVVPLSRPFGSIVIDARVDCDDGTFYNPRELFMTDDSTDPLSVGEIGEVQYRVDECAGSYTKITLTPRFPEWRCSGCVAYEPKKQ